MSLDDADKARAREIIEAFFLERGGEIARIRRVPARTIVITDGGWWRVRREDAAQERLSLAGYELFTVEEEAYVDPPPLSWGVARLGDGRMFLLDEPHQLRAFFAATAGALPPADLAGLLSRFQLGSRTAPYQHLILTLEDLAKELEPEQIQAIPELTPLQFTRREDGGLLLEFCTHLRGRRGNPDEGWISVLRWQAEATGAYELTWSSRILANHLAPRRWKEIGILDIILAREREKE